MRKMRNSGVSHIGTVPDNWEVNPLKAHYSFDTGFTPPSGEDEHYDPNGETWITIADMKDGHTDSSEKHITKAYAEQKGKKMPAGSLMYSFKLSVGKTSILGCDAYTNEAIATFPVDKNPHINFLRYSAMFIEGNANENIYGAKILNQQLIKNAPMPFPPIPEQRVIASYLDSKCAAIDEAIERHKMIIERLEEYKRASIIAMVSGRPEHDVRKSGIPWMPAVPSGWDIIPLRFALTPRKNKNEGMAEDNLLTLSYGKIKRKSIDTNEGLLPASFEGYNIVEAGDIVLRLIDLQNDKHSLRTGLVTERGIITSAYVTVTPSNRFVPAFMRYLLHAYDLMKVFYSMGEGVRQGLSYDDLGRNLLIPCPPKEVQEGIASEIEKLENKVDAAIEKQDVIIAKLEEYRKTIIYNAVTGKIDCRTEASSQA